MRRVLLIVALLFGAILQAQSQHVVEGSIDILADQTQINVVADYSKASIMNMTEAEYGEYEPNWAKAKPTIVSKFVDGLIDKIDERIIFGRLPHAQYTLRWVVLHVNTKGDTWSDIVVENSSGEVVLRITDLKGDGGTFGTKLNLMGDGAVESGEVLGKFLRRNLFSRF